MVTKLFFTFDIPLDKPSFRVKAWRILKKMGAEQKMRSYWLLPYTERNLSDLKTLGREIVKSGGLAEIVEGNVIYITR